MADMARVQRPAEVTAEAFLAAVALLGGDHAAALEVESLAWGEIGLRMRFSPRFLRPGNTISGPTMFALCDAALWGAVWSATGAALMSVTSDLALHFLRRPGPTDLIAHARVLDVKPSLAYGEVTVRSGDGLDPVCHASGCYVRVASSDGA